MMIKREMGKGEEASQGSLNPSRPASTIPGSRQAGPESGSNLPPASDGVKGKEQYAVQTDTIDSASLMILSRV